MNTSTLHRIAAVSLILAVAGAVLALLVPAPAGQNPSTFHSLFAITTLMIITHFGGALLFTIGLRGFSDTFKAAYTWLVVGFTILAIGFMQLPLMSIFHWEKAVWSTYGFIALPFIFSIIAIYIGARGFARLFGVKNILTSAAAAAGMAIVISLLSILIPNGTPNVETTAVTIQVSKFALALPAVFSFWALILAYQARKRAGSLYIPAVAWLVVYLLLTSISSIAGVIARYIQPGRQVAFEAGYLYILYVVAGIALLKAGIEFNKIRFGRKTSLLAQEQTFFGNPRGLDAADGNRLPDIITYTVGLASNAKAIDSMLDDFRVVTATLQEGQSFNDFQQAQLAQSYGRLETYLSEQEPVRPVDRQELRSTIRTRFAPVLADNPVFARTAFGD